MKRVICAAIAAIVLTAGPLAGRARAEDGKNDVKEGGRQGEFVEKKIKKNLGLSDDQVAKLQAAWEAEALAVKPLREKEREATDKLEEQVRDLASDKDIQATLDQLDAGHKAMAAEHQKLEGTLAATLKPYQRAKMRLFMKRRGHGKPGGKHSCGSEKDRGGEHARSDEGREGWEKHHGKERAEDRGEDRDSDDD